MRFLVAAAALAGLANAQGLNFEKVFAKQAHYKTATAATTTPVNREAIAASIVNKLNDQKRMTVTATTMTSSSSSVKTSTKKATSTTRAKSSTQRTSSSKHTTSTSSATKAKTISPAKKHVARDGTCAPQSNFFSYTPTNVTSAGFIVDTTLYNIATAALAPAGYTANFTGQFGSMYANNYIGYYLLPSYDVSQCSAYCDATAAVRLSTSTSSVIPS